MALYVVSVDGIALAAATLKTVLQLNTTATKRCKIVEWWVEFDGVTASNVPVLATVGRYSAAVTTATTIVAAAMDGADGTATTVAKHTCTSEGAGTVTVGMPNHRIPPTSGIWYQAPLGRELIIPVSGFWRIVLTSAAVVNATVGVMFDE